MTQTRWMVLVLALSACGTKPEGPREICGNGVDDDANGKIDCNDPDCAGQAACVGNLDGGNFGPCLKCGAGCNKQADCLAVSFQSDTPLPECIANKCQMLNTNVQVHFEVDTQTTWNGFMYPLQALNTRMVSKRAVDGTAVSCATVQAAAMGKLEADADQIEKSGLFNLRGYDVAPVQAMGGQIIRQPFVNVGTGVDFIIWTELWAGKPGTSSKLPTGNRYGWGCFETGPEVGPVVASDHCSTNADAGVCRTMRVKMPGPQ